LEDGHVFGLQPNGIYVLKTWNSLNTDVLDGRLRQRRDFRKSVFLGAESRQLCKPQSDSKGRCERDQNYAWFSQHALLGGG
jgi:hypothetical protein